MKNCSLGFGVVISWFTQIFSKNNSFLFQTFAGGGLHLPTPCLPFLCLPPPPPQPVGRLHAQVGSDDRKEERRPQRRIHFGWFRRRRIQLWWEFWIWRKFFFFRSPGSEFWSFVGLRWSGSIGLQHCLWRGVQHLVWAGMHNGVRECVQHRV